MLNIELISPYGQARFETPAREVTDFLRPACFDLAFLVGAGLTVPERSSPPS